MAPNPPGSLMRLKNEPSAVNMSVDVKDVPSPSTASAVNQGAASAKDAAPGGKADASAVSAMAQSRRRKYPAMKGW